MSLELVVRGWRIVASARGPGLLMWFDPTLEQPLLRTLTRDEASARVDRSVSVSALVEVEGSVVSDEDPIQLYPQLDLPLGGGS